MKYTIEGFSQQALVELKCDATDAVFLRWFADFIHSGKMTTRTIDGETYYWLRYSYVLEELPIINVKQQQLVNRIHRLVEHGVMAVEVVRDDTGTHTFFRLIPAAWQRLTDQPAGNEVRPRGGRKLPAPPTKKVLPKDSSITPDQSIKDKTPPEDGPDVDYSHRSYGSDFEALYEAYPRHVNKKGAYKAFHARVKEGVSVETLSTAVTEYRIAVKGKEQEYIMHPATFFGPNHRYEDYLPKAPAAKRKRTPQEEEDDLMREYEHVVDQFVRYGYKTDGEWLLAHKDLKARHDEWMKRRQNVPA